MTVGILKSKADRQVHIEAAIKHLLNDDEVAATNELKKVLQPQGDIMPADHLLRIDDDIYIGISNEYRDLAIEKTSKRLNKAVDEWKKASDRADKINDQMPYDIQRQTVDRWLTAIENVYGLKDTLKSFGVKVVIV